MSIKIAFSTFSIFAILLTALTAPGLYDEARGDVAPQKLFGTDSPPRLALPGKFRLLMWNVYKGGFFGQQAAEVEKHGKRADLMLFQEAIDERGFIAGLLAAKPMFRWSMASAFTNGRGISTGVATGSDVVSLRSEAWLSKVFEPITNTPKTILVTEYHIEGNTETLLVANIHAINFVGNDAFEKHIDQLISVIRAHSGPMIVGGDFNVWNEARRSYMLQATQSLGLKKIEVPGERGPQLDHVFSRGLSVLAAKQIEDAYSSDHKPLSFTLSTEP